LYVGIFNNLILYFVSRLNKNAGVNEICVLMLRAASCEHGN